MATVPWSSVFRVFLLVILLAAIVIAFVTLPIEKVTVYASWSCILISLGHQLCAVVAFWWSWCYLYTGFMFSRVMFFLFDRFFPRVILYSLGFSELEFFWSRGTSGLSYSPPQSEWRWWRKEDCLPFFAFRVSDWNAPFKLALKQQRTILGNILASHL